MIDPSNGVNPDGSDDGESEGLDVERLREMGGFVVRAARRRWKLALTTFVLVATLGITAGATMPKTYSAEVKLLAQGTSAIRVLSSSNPGMESLENPTKNIAPMILRRDNLIALVKDAHLVERFEDTRSPALRLKDRVSAKLFGPVSPDDRLLSLALTLESRVDVSIKDDSLVDIVVDWSNPQIAYDLATLVEKNFLEARYDSDVAAINESISLLDDHAKNELAIVDTELDEYQKVVAARALATAAAAPAIMPQLRAPLRSATFPRAMGAPAASAFLVDPEVTKALEDKRLRIRALEDDQQRAVDGLRQQLLQAQLTLTPMHPTVIALQQRLAAVSEPTPELAQLRAEEHALMAQIVPPKPIPPPAPIAQGGSAASRPVPGAEASADPEQPAAAAAAPTPIGPSEGTLRLAQSKLEAAIRSYQDAAGRSDAARDELDITRAAYKHRYTVFTPAEVPLKPKKPTAELVGFGSVLAGVLLAFLLAAAADLSTGLVLESWQVKRRLKVDILGELDNPS